MRKLLIVLCVLICSINSAAAQVSVGITAPGVSIGINVPVYPQLVPVPGYPVYYAPQVNSNYFFYDGMYWVYQGDNWYTSSWYNGPWVLVGAEAVPLFILRVPVRYYRRPPSYFHGWASNAPPHWGDHWGNAWVQSRQGWDNWDRSSVPAAAPLPTYQRQYSGNKYPRAEQQQVLLSQNYHYQPRDAFVQQHYQAQHVQTAPAAATNATQGVSEDRRASHQAQQTEQASQQRAQQQQTARQQKAQQQQAASQQKAQQQQQRQAASQQKAQQQQQRQAESQQKAQQQQQRQAESQQKAQQQQQRQAESQQKAQQQQQQQHQQTAALQRAQHQPQAAAQHEQKAPKQASEKGEQQGRE